MSGGFYQEVDVIAVERVVVDFYLELFSDVKEELRDQSSVLFQPQNGKSCSKNQVFGMFHPFHNNFVSWAFTMPLDESLERVFQTLFKS